MSQELRAIQIAADPVHQHPSWPPQGAAVRHELRLIANPGTQLGRVPAHLFDDGVGIEALAMLHLAHRRVETRQNAFKLGGPFLAGRVGG